MTVQAIKRSSSANRIFTFAPMKKIIILSIITLIALCAGYAYYLYQKPHTGIANEKPVFQLSSVALVGDYDKDEAAANTKYLGKVLEVTGVISEKIKDEKGKYIITLQAADLSGVGCVFDPTQLEDTKKLSEGEEVTIKGICTGVLMDVELVDCIVVK